MSPITYIINDQIQTFFEGDKLQGTSWSTASKLYQANKIQALLRLDWVEIRIINIKFSSSTTLDSGSTHNIQKITCGEQYIKCPTI